MKQGRRGRGYHSHSIETGGSMPTLNIASEPSRRASIFDRSLGIPDFGTRDRLSNRFDGPACDLSWLSRIRPLAYKGRKRPWRFAFLPVGRAFSGG